ncbi:hypothetical protein ACFXGD_13025 [Streptomyces albidoflavus]
MPPAFLTTPTPRRTLLRGLGAGAAGFTITDQRGREIRLDGPVERIAAAIIPPPSMVAAVDGSHSRIVGVNESTLQANKEGVFGTLLGTEKRASGLVDWMHEEDAAVRKLVASQDRAGDPVSVLYLRTAADGWTTANKTRCMNHWTEPAGASTSPATRPPAPRRSPWSRCSPGTRRSSGSPASTPPSRPPSTPTSASPVSAPSANAASTRSRSAATAGTRPAASRL